MDSIISKHLLAPLAWTVLSTEIISHYLDN